MTSRRRIQVAGAAAIACFLLLVARYYDPIYGFSFLLELGSAREERTVAAFREYPVFVHPRSVGYDGQDYAQIAQHPALADAALEPAVDALPSRARRIAVPAAAWMLGAGRAPWVI